MLHLLDTNVFVEAHRTYLALDVAPTFWSWLTSGRAKGRIASVRRVRDELTAGDAAGKRYPLARWALDVSEDFWLPVTSESVSALRELTAWAADPARPYSQAAVSEFMDSADLHLIAQAAGAGAVVVTREKPDPQCRRRVKIPDACEPLGVTCVDTYAFLRAAGLRL
ncbi:DUF4411 family protein [Arthrobacter sp. UM1]|uniref:DUF4411 family protein n=1 Tax=Arthrobacter sp. UM1 TaxID=2766776 RepID=UPI001CF68949|nr:DUF4411 family protein [Arthrobacter sp. UM1]MCB4209224.1 DUF4411 family protein [Arthrobacter sp. UM1]